MGAKKDKKGGRRKFIEYCAHKHILEDLRAHLTAHKKAPYKTITWKTFHCHGGLSAIKGRIKGGELNVEKLLPPYWTPDFAKGLIDSGYVWEYKPFRYKFNWRINKGLIKDIKELKIPCRYSVNICGNVRITNFPLLYYGTIKSYGADYIGGLFCGCRIKRHLGKNWLMMKKSAINGLDKWGIVYKEYNGRILVSPFYGKLIAYKYAPINCRMGLELVKEAGDGESLGLFYKYCMGHFKGRRFNLVSGELPYLRSYGWYFSKGMNKDERYNDLRKLGLDMGIVKVTDGMRQILGEYIEAHKGERLNSSTELSH